MGASVSTKLQSNIHDIYKFDEVIGRGWSSTVYKATLIGGKRRGVHGNIPETVAIKKISKAGLSNRDFNALSNEVRALRCINHSFCVKFFEAFETKEEIFFVTEYVEGVTLRELILTRPKLQEVETAKIMLQLLSAIAYLHHKGIVHGEIEAENIIVTYVDGLPLIKLVDFGLARQLNNEVSLKDKRTDIYCVSPTRLSPAVFESKNSTKVDMWSVGCVMHTLLCGTAPYSPLAEQSSKRVLGLSQKIAYQHSDRSHLSKIMDSIVKRLLSEDPRERPEATSVIRDLLYFCNNSEKERQDSDLRPEEVVCE